MPWSFVGAVDGTVLTYDPVTPPGAPTTLSAGETVSFLTDALLTVRSQDAQHPFHAAAHMTSSTFGGGSPGGGSTTGDADRYVFFTDFTFPDISLTIVRRKTAAGFARSRSFAWVSLTRGLVSQKLAKGTSRTRATAMRQGWAAARSTPRLRRSCGKLAGMPGNRSNEPDGDVYKALLASTKAIPWRIDWATMTFAYVGPQIESLLGWTPESLATVQDWAERIHPDDKWVVDFRVAQSKAGVDHEADYRALAKNGNYLWLRDVVHVVRKEDGTVEALVGFMFDISERKKTEERLVTLQKDLENLSFRDGLTGIGNRRRFDTLFGVEWAAGRRNQRPLSLLMVDIDFFKQYNDRYGHAGGDDCLKRVAASLSKSATRPRDFVARHGGEEFVVLLSETDERGALHVAERCRDALAKEAIVHEASTVSPLVTVSIGVSTMVPTPEAAPLAFIEEADQRLYRAKASGRNTIVGA